MRYKLYGSRTWGFYSHAECKRDGGFYYIHKGPHPRKAGYELICCIQPECGFEVATAKLESLFTYLGEIEVIEIPECTI